MAPPKNLKVEPVQKAINRVSLSSAASKGGTLVKQHAGNAGGSQLASIFSHFKNPVKVSEPNDDIKVNATYDADSYTKTLNTNDIIENENIQKIIQLLKKMTRRNDTTRKKALEDFMVYLNSSLGSFSDSSTVIDVAESTNRRLPCHLPSKENTALRTHIENEFLVWVPEFCRVYNANVLFDSERDIRYGLNKAIGMIASTLRRRFAPFIRIIFPYWWFSCYEDDLKVSNAAREAMNSVFSETDIKKRLDVILFCKDNIIAEMVNLLSCTEVEISKRLSSSSSHIIPQAICEEIYDRIISSTILSLGELIVVLSTSPSILETWEKDLQFFFLSTSSIAIYSYLLSTGYRDIVYESVCLALCKILSAYTTCFPGNVKKFPTFLINGEAERLLALSCLGVFKHHSETIQNVSPSLFMAFLKFYPESFAIHKPEDLIYVPLCIALQHNGYSARLTGCVPLFDNLASMLSVIPVNQLIYTHTGRRFIMMLFPSILLTFKKESSSFYMMKLNQKDICLSFYQTIIFLLDKRLLPSIQHQMQHDDVSYTTVETFIQDIIRHWFWCPLELVLQASLSDIHRFLPLNLSNRFQNLGQKGYFGTNLTTIHMSFLKDLSSFSTLFSWVLKDIRNRQFPMSIFQQCESIIRVYTTILIEYIEQDLPLSSTECNSVQQYILFLQQMELEENQLFHFIALIFEALFLSLCRQLYDIQSNLFLSNDTLHMSQIMEVKHKSILEINSMIYCILLKWNPNYRHEEHIDRLQTKIALIFNDSSLFSNGIVNTSIKDLKTTNGTIQEILMNVILPVIQSICFGTRPVNDSKISFSLLSNGIIYKLKDVSSFKIYVLTLQSCIDSFMMPFFSVHSSVYVETVASNVYSLLLTNVVNTQKTYPRVLQDPFYPIDQLLLDILRLGFIYRLHYHQFMSSDMLLLTDILSNSTLISVHLLQTTTTYSSLQLNQLQFLRRELYQEIKSQIEKIGTYTFPSETPDDANNKCLSINLHLDQMVHLFLCQTTLCLNDFINTTSFWYSETSESHQLKLSLLLESFSFYCNIIHYVADSHLNNTNNTTETYMMPLKYSYLDNPIYVKTNMSNALQLLFSMLLSQQIYNTTHQNVYLKQFTMQWESKKIQFFYQTLSLLLQAIDCHAAHTLLRQHQEMLYFPSLFDPQKPIQFVYWRDLVYMCGKVDCHETNVTRVNSPKSIWSFLQLVPYHYNQNELQHTDNTTVHLFNKLSMYAYMSSLLCSSQFIDNDTKRHDLKEFFDPINQMNTVETTLETTGIEVDQIGTVLLYSCISEIIKRQMFYLMDSFNRPNTIHTTGYNDHLDNHYIFIQSLYNHDSISSNSSLFQFFFITFKTYSYYLRQLNIVTNEASWKYIHSLSEVFEYLLSDILQMLLMNLQHDKKNYSDGCSLHQTVLHTCWSFALKTQQLSDSHPMIETMIYSDKSCRRLVYITLYWFYKQVIHIHCEEFISPFKKLISKVVDDLSYSMTLFSSNVDHVSLDTTLNTISDYIAIIVILLKLFHQGKIEYSETLYTQLIPKFQSFFMAYADYITEHLQSQTTLFTFCHIVSEIMGFFSFELKYPQVNHLSTLSIGLSLLHTIGTLYIQGIEQFNTRIFLPSSCLSLLTFVVRSILSHRYFDSKIINQLICTVIHIYFYIFERTENELSDYFPHQLYIWFSKMGSFMLSVQDLLSATLNKDQQFLHLNHSQDLSIPLCKLFTRCTVQWNHSGLKRWIMYMLQYTVPFPWWKIPLLLSSDSLSLLNCHHVSVPKMNDGTLLPPAVYNLPPTTTTEISEMNTKESINFNTEHIISLLNNSCILHTVDEIISPDSILGPDNLYCILECLIGEYWAYTVCNVFTILTQTLSQATTVCGYKCKQTTILYRLELMDLATPFTTILSLNELTIYMDIWLCLLQHLDCHTPHKNLAVLLDLPLSTPCHTDELRLQLEQLINNIVPYNQDCLLNDTVSSLIHKTIQCPKYEAEHSKLFTQTSLIQCFIDVLTFLLIIGNDIASCFPFLKEQTVSNLNIIYQPCCLTESSSINKFDVVDNTLVDRLTPDDKIIIKQFNCFNSLWNDTYANRLEKLKVQQSCVESAIDITSSSVLTTVKKLICLIVKIFPSSLRFGTILDKSIWMTPKLLSRLEMIFRTTLSSELINQDVQELQRYLIKDEEDNLESNVVSRMTYMNSLRLLTITFHSFVKDIMIELQIQFDDTYPLRCPLLTVKEMRGINHKQLERWLFLSRQVLLGGKQNNKTIEKLHKNYTLYDTWDNDSHNLDNKKKETFFDQYQHKLQSSITNSIKLFKNNITGYVSGLEECYICYSVVYGPTQSLPTQECSTCHHKFHKICVERWFSTSTKGLCPLCQADFF